MNLSPCFSKALNIDSLSCGSPGNQVSTPSYPADLARKQKLSHDSCMPQLVQKNSISKSTGSPAVRPGKVWAARVPDAVMEARANIRSKRRIGLSNYRTDHFPAHIGQAEGTSLKLIG